MIGRKKELEKFQDAVSKDRAQLIAVYGRRRVGKTFLVNEFCGNKYSFKHTAVSPVDDASGKKKKNLMRIQLQEFYYSMRTYGLDSGSRSQAVGSGLSICWKISCRRKTMDPV